MQLTKFTHSCVRLTDGDRTLVIDPGTFSEVETALEGVHAVLVTHEHPDHVDVDALTAAASADPDLRVWCPGSVANLLGDLPERVTVVGAGESFSAGGLSVHTYGGQHALIHGSVPVVPNLGYLVEDSVFHPGDSLTVPDVAVETLLVPTHAPWSKVGEVLDFVIAVRPRVAHQIHDGLLNDRGLKLVHGQVDRISTQYGSRFEPLDAGTSVDL